MNGTAEEKFKAFISVILGLVSVALIGMLLNIDFDYVPRLLLIIWWMVNAHIIFFIIK